jgi:hypothetical protein
MTHRVHASMNAVKPACVQPSLDARSRESERQQLILRDDTVLPARQNREFSVT